MFQTSQNGYLKICVIIFEHNLKIIYYILKNIPFNYHIFYWKVSVLDDKDDLVEEFGDIVNAKIELPIRKNHIDLLIDVFRKKRVRYMKITKLFSIFSWT